MSIISILMKKATFRGCRAFESCKVHMVDSKEDYRWHYCDFSHCGFGDTGDLATLERN